jgi:hypothetical protein
MTESKDKEGKGREKETKEGQMSEKWGRYIRYLYCSKNRQPTKLTSFF